MKLPSKNKQIAVACIFPAGGGVEKVDLVLLSHLLDKHSIISSTSFNHTNSKTQILEFCGCKMVLAWCEINPTACFPTF